MPDGEQTETAAPPNGSRQVDPLAHEMARLLAMEITRAIGQTAGGFLTKIKFKRKNLDTGVEEEITTCVSQQLENISIALAANTRIMARHMAAVENLTNAIATLIEGDNGLGELIAAMDENTAASKVDDEPMEPPPRKRRRGG